MRTATQSSAKILSLQAKKKSHIFMDLENIPHLIVAHFSWEWEEQTSQVENSFTCSYSQC